MFKHTLIYNTHSRTLAAVTIIAHFYKMPKENLEVEGKSVSFYTDESLTSMQRGGLIHVARADDMKFNQAEQEPTKTEEG